MSRTTGLQRRTTYLISLTLVKLESVAAPGEPEQAGGGGDGAPQPGPPAAAARAEDPGGGGGKSKRPERLFQRQDALWISTAGSGPTDAPVPPGSPRTPSPGPAPAGEGSLAPRLAEPRGGHGAHRPRSPASTPAAGPPAVPPKPDPASLPPAVPPKPDPASLPAPAASWAHPEGAPEGARPPPHPAPGACSPHPAAGARRLRLAGPKPFKTVTTSGARVKARPWITATCTRARGAWRPPPPSPKRA
ncbi:arf-GAP with GTPase, ANK repeat and PH domain-containing protein 2-like [Mycteria americana]|uniref:arf-GAP with GTPase, ANK repeat and PH domain-containing protein 2-like n=1 Tax=Mycteria americana TaxID=33587 RepID=UPI003F58E725